MSILAKRKISFTIGIAVSALSLFWLYKTVDLREVAVILKTADIGMLFLSCVVMSCSYCIRAVRWKLFLVDIVASFKDAYGALIIGFFMNNILPARIGEIIRAQVTGKSLGISRMYALATIASERLFDGFVISLLFGLIFTFGAKTSSHTYSDGIYYVAYFFFAASILCALFIIKRGYLLYLLEIFTSKFNSNKAKYLISRLSIFIKGFDSLSSFSSVMKIFSYSLIVWLVELSVYYIVAQAFDITLPITILIVFLAAVNFSSLIPSAPGGIGVIEVLASLALMEVGVPREIAVSLVFTQHMIQILIVAIPGLYFFMKYMTRNRNDIYQIDEDMELVK